MENFSYAHRDTSGMARWNTPRIPESLQAVRQSAFGREIPISGDETLSFLMAQAAAIKPDSILELGTAVGVTSAAMLLACPAAQLTTVERDHAFFEEAKNTYHMCGLQSRVRAIEGDAGEVIDALSGPFDMIFLDCAKVQYVKYLPRLKQLLSAGGVLIADDVLLYGWASGEAEVPKKRRMLAKHIEEYLVAVTSDPGLFTSVIKVGDGIALSVKR